MRILETIVQVKEFVQAAKQQGKTIGLVPTMGALHEGHLTLMREAKQQHQVVIASIFVNPTQFGPNEDLARYPRDLAGDSEKAASAGVDAIFHPQPSEMYPKGYVTYVEVEGITERLCGQSRPGHFRGVATVVTKLFNIVQPDAAYFGQKDAQQVLVIQRMVEDLHLPVKVIVVPIVREADGLAMSSRNRYLQPKERQGALVLSRSLQLAQELVVAGERNRDSLCRKVRQYIEQEPLAEIDYVEVYSYPDLQAPEQLAAKNIVALAVRIGTTRLIDNVILEVQLC